MLVRLMLLHHMALFSVRLFCKNLGNLQEFFGQMVYRPPWQKIARTPMTINHTEINVIDADGDVGTTATIWVLLISVVHIP